MDFFPGSAGELAILIHMSLFRRCTFVLIVSAVIDFLLTAFGGPANDTF